MYEVLLYINDNTICQDTFIWNSSNTQSTILTAVSKTFSMESRWSAQFCCGVFLLLLWCFRGLIGVSDIINLEITLISINCFYSIPWVLIRHLGAWVILQLYNSFLLWQHRKQHCRQYCHISLWNVTLFCWIYYVSFSLEFFLSLYFWFFFV